MASCSLRIHNSCHNQADHELSRIKSALEVLLGVKCFFTNKGSVTFSHENENSTKANETKSVVTTETSGTGTEKSEVEQIQNENYSSDDDNAFVLTIEFETNLSSEDISRAKKFVLSHLSSTPNYIVSTHSLATQRAFDMVVQSASSIQSETSALLTFDPNPRKVSIQGRESNVKSAQSKIVMILDTLGEHSGGSYPVHSEISPEDLYIEPINMKVSPTIQQGNLIKKHSEDVLALKMFQADFRLSPTSTFVASYPSSKDPDFSRSEVEGGSVTGISESTAKMSVSSPDPAEISTDEDSFPESSDEEEISRDPSADEKYNKHFEMALKRGFSENQVEKALNKLGLDCPFNDLLSELISISSFDSGQEQEAKQKDLKKYNRDVVSSGSLEVAAGVPQTPFSPQASYVVTNTSQLATDPNHSSNLRHIIIDGSNVAMSHGKNHFSCQGIKIAVDWFRARGHKYITAFVPKWRKESSRPDAPITDQELLVELELEKVLSFTPARRVKGRRVVCYDDRYILKLAVETDGIVVSNDVYRDLVSEREDFRHVVDQRLLMYTFVGDRFMPPEDPLGRSGPTLDNFLRKVPVDPRPRPQDCPYGKKCTYGNKCRFYHPERGFAHQKSVTETLKEQAVAKLQERASKMEQEKVRRPKQKLFRTKSLIPGASYPSSTDLSGSSASNTQKPKFAHSTSLNLSSSKTPDYLDSARRAMEQFSSEQAVILADERREKGGARLSPYAGSPRGGSPTLPVEGASRQTLSPKEGVVVELSGLHESTPVRKTASSPSPVPTKNIVQQVSPSHLPVPVSEQREPYVSGHLAVAQKLSDEGSDSNFFSEHTASRSASSTPRTTSPVVSALTSSSQKRHKSKSSSSKGATEEVLSESPQLHRDLVAQALEDAETFERDAAAYLPGIPNLSIFLDESSKSSAHEIDVASKREDAISNTDVSSNWDSPAPGEKYFLPPSSFQTPFVSTANMIQTPPAFYGMAPENSGRRHTLSSTANKNQSELARGPDRRRVSEHATNQSDNRHMTLRPQSSVPCMARQQTSMGPKASNTPGLMRQNSSSDPQIHIAGMHPMATPSNFANSGSVVPNIPPLANVQVEAHNFNQGGAQHRHNNFNEGNISGLPYQNVQYGPHYDNRAEPVAPTFNQLYNRRMQQQQQQQHLQQQQQHHQAFAFEQQPAGQALSHFPTPLSRGGGDGNLSSQFPPSMPLYPGPGMTSYQHEQPLLSYQQVPPHYGNGATQERMMGMQHMFVSSPNNSYASMTTDFPLHFNQPPPNFLPSPSLQHFNQSAPQMYLPAPTSVSQPNDGYPSPIYQHFPPSVQQLKPEDTLIPPSDPRHDLYCSLKLVFYEEVVRKVMNENPHLYKADDVIKKIMEILNHPQL